MIFKMTIQKNSVSPEPNIFQMDGLPAAPVVKQESKMHGLSTLIKEGTSWPGGKRAGVVESKKVPRHIHRWSTHPKTPLDSNLFEPGSQSTKLPLVGEDKTFEESHSRRERSIWSRNPLQGKLPHSNVISTPSDSVMSQPPKPSSVYSAPKGAPHVQNRSPEPASVDNKTLFEALFPAGDSAPQDLVQTQATDFGASTMDPIFVEIGPQSKDLAGAVGTTLHSNPPEESDGEVKAQSLDPTIVMMESGVDNLTEIKPQLEGPTPLSPINSSTELQITGSKTSISDSESVADKQTTLLSEPVKPSSTVDAQALWEELFPPEASKQFRGDIEDHEKTIPRLPLPVEEGSMTLLRKVEVGEFKVKQGEIIQSANREQRMTVLELHSANVSLTEDDFRRLTPKGKHMREWSVGGEFMNVFPRRNPWTLQREPPGNYYIIFRNVDSARAYLEHIQHVHRLAKQYTPTSLASPIAPPPGYLIDGEDIHSLIKNFTLVAPTQQLIVTTYTIGAGTSPFKINLFARGGYPEIVGEGRQKVPQVKLRMLHGPQPTYYEISDAIGKSGIDRNLAWALIERPERIRKLEMERYLRDKSQDEADWDSEERAERIAKFQRPGYGQVWILSFEDMESAKSFVRCWHQRPFPWKKKVEKNLTPSLSSRRYGHQVTMVEAELLW
jgi:hypothetical protein